MRAVARMVREPPFFDVAGRAEEALGLLQGVGVHTAGEHLAGSRLDGVVGAGQAGDGVQEDHDVVAAFHQAAGLVQDHVGHLDVALGGFVERRGDNLRLDAALHVGHFLRALVDQEDDLINLGVIVCDGIGYGLEEHGLTGLGLGDDKAALSLADRGEHIHDAAGRILFKAVAEKVEFLRREEGSEEIERNAVPDEFRRAAVDVLDLDQREILVAFARRTDFTGDGIAVLQGVLLDLLLGNVDVVRGVQVIVVRGTEETVAVRHDFQHARGLDGAFEFDALRALVLLLLTCCWRCCCCPCACLVVALYCAFFCPWGASLAGASSSAFWRSTGSLEPLRLSRLLPAQARGRAASGPLRSASAFLPLERQAFFSSLSPSAGFSSAGFSAGLILFLAAAILLAGTAALLGFVLDGFLRLDDGLGVQDGESQRCSSISSRP